MLKPRNERPKNEYLTVSQVTEKIKGLLETEVGRTWVRGEISGFKPSAAGHLYFSLKDDSAVLSCAIFRGRGSKFPADTPRLQDGLEVIAHGHVSVYAPRGGYQLIVDTISPVGEGALQLAFEQLKTKLQKEGLFESTSKKKIPPFPEKIAIITSPTGAALQDMLNILGRRNAGISILVVPTLVQGPEAASGIILALETVNKYQLAEVVVIARGGGSSEDLWCFNDEALVRAVVASTIPVISAIGHEVDFTLCDFAADLRAPTPSAAAELVSQNRLELIWNVAQMKKRLSMAMMNLVSRKKSRLLWLENKMLSPSDRLHRLQKQLSELEMRMMVSIDNVYDSKKQRLESMSAKLDALSPLKVLGRGYSLVRDAATGVVVKSVKQAKTGLEVSIIFQDGKSMAKFIG